MNEDAERFVATHVIQTGTRRWYVHAEEPDPPGNGLILYTEAEWGADANADWEYDEDDGLVFQGNAYHPMCNGAEFMKFESSLFRHSDGWNDDGTRRTKTKAEWISGLLGNDGQRWKTDLGNSLDRLSREAGARVEYRDGHGTSVYRYTFRDSSVITVAGDAWDLGYTDCYCWQGTPVTPGAPPKHANKECSLSPDYEVAS